MTGSRYVVEINGCTRYLRRDQAVAWVQGVGDVLDPGVLEQRLDPGAAEETRCIEALMIGHEKGWFVYKYLLPGT